MTKYPIWLLALLVAALAAPGCGSSAGHEGHEGHHDGARAAHHDDGDDERDDDDGEEMEEEIALSAVPANVLAAAQAALPGATFTEAERETEGGVVVYCLEGVKDGVEWEVEVGADGKVLEVEREDD